MGNSYHLLPPPVNFPELQPLTADTHLSPSQELRNTDVEKVGGKSASLGEMISQLSDVGVPVPGPISGWI